MGEQQIRAALALMQTAKLIQKTRQRLVDSIDLVGIPRGELPTLTAALSASGVLQRGLAALKPKPPRGSEQARYSRHDLLD